MPFNSAKYTQFNLKTLAKEGYTRFFQGPKDVTQRYADAFKSQEVQAYLQTQKIQILLLLCQGKIDAACGLAQNIHNQLERALDVTIYSTDSDLQSPKHYFFKPDTSPY